jgi:hypothetical protein
MTDNTNAERQRRYVAKLKAAAAASDAHEARIKELEAAHASGIARLKAQIKRLRGELRSLKTENRRTI